MGLHIKLNSDKEIVEEVRAALKENDGYCPCRKEKKPEYKCICQDFLFQKEKGFCHCGLYEKI